MKRKKRKRRVWKFILAMIIFFAFAAGTVILLFQTRSIKVKGNEYYGETSVATWIQNDKLAVNTLYILWKYNFTDAELPSAVESMKVSLKSPWAVQVTVKEKEMLGYVDHDGTRLYFDKDGMIVLRTKREIKGVPYIEGLDLEAGKAEVGKSLPVEDNSIFDKIMEASKYLKKYELTPDRIVCVEKGLALYFGKAEVLLGSGNYEDRLAQVEPILKELKEKYPEQAGTLHLENYDSTSASIRFVPAKEEKKKEE